MRLKFWLITAAVIGALYLGYDWFIADPGEDPAAARTLTPHQRDIVERGLGAFLVYPETSHWRITSVKPYLGREKLICGEVNYQTASHIYVGFQPFYSILDGEQVDETAMADSTGNYLAGVKARLKFFCGVS